MGNNSGKPGGPGSIRINEAELPHLSRVFEQIGGGKKIKESDLTNFWSSHISQYLLKGICNCLFVQDNHRVQTIDFNRFTELYGAIVGNNIDAKTSVIFACTSTCTTSDMPCEILVKFVESVINSFYKLQHIGSQEEYISWEKNGHRACTDIVSRLAEHLTHDVYKKDTKTINYDEIEKWLAVNPEFLKMFESVFFHLYHNRPNRKYGKDLLPLCKNLPLEKFPKLLDISQILFVNSCIPMQYRTEWRFLFSSMLQGESFSTLMGKVLNKGPCVIFVQDEDGYLFGGFASASLRISPNFEGNESSFLFGLTPRIFSCSTTGYNNHYQYLNLHQQTMPNGLGMGGQFDYWGLWLDSEYGKGSSSESCTTFKGYKQLSGKKNFKVKNIEVWAVGNPKLHQPDSEDEEDGCGRSILDKNAEDKAMLEMIGKGPHSDGLREPQ